MLRHMFCCRKYVVIVTGEKSVSGEIVEFRECSWSELKTLLTVIDLEVELEGLEVYPMHSLNVGHDLGFNKLKHLCTKPIRNFFFLWAQRTPQILHLFFLCFSYCHPPNVCWGWCVFNHTALSVSVGPTWCLCLPRAVSNI